MQNEFENIAKETEASEQALTNDVEGFRLTRADDPTKTVDILARRDDKGDYPVLQLEFQEDDGTVKKLFLKRDEISAITFALSREDQQSKLLASKFRQYKEVPVRLVVQATKDIKKGEYVVVWRKERVPLDFNYTK